MWNRSIKQSLVWIAFTASVLLGAGVSQAWAHAERPAFFPVNRVSARPAYRPMLDVSGNPSLQANRLVVCKKPGQEGVAAGTDSATLIKTIKATGLRRANEQLYSECKFEHLQAAVDAVTTRGTTIYVLPGLYKEQPSIRALENNFGAKSAQDRTYCQAVLARGVGELSYQEQYRCPHIQNTVAIFGDPDFTDDNCGTQRTGKCAGDPKTLACDPAKSACQYYDLQIEGTGQKVTDVVFSGDFINKPGDPADGHFRYLNGIRADRADGIYLRNFTTQIYEFNAVYAMEIDGFVFDHLLSRWVDEYAFLSFASDHGLYDYTEGYNVADSVQYPGSGADIYPNATHAGVDLRKRQATEIRNSKGHHSALGYSGTAGNAPYVHDSEFYKNQTGMATESIYGGHPGMPQDHALFENNKIYSNNKDYYRFVSTNGPCVNKAPRDRGVVPPEAAYFDRLPADHQEAVMDRTIVCPPIPFPTGTGIIIGGGNYNVIQNNQIFDNWRQGTWLISAPTLIHMINEPYAPKPVPGALTGMIPAPVGGPVNDANSMVGALKLAIDTGSAPLLLRQPVYTAHYNRFLTNRLGENALVAGQSFKQPNGVDFWWDGSGKGNCWKGNTSSSGSIKADTDVLHPLPGDCPDGDYTNLINQVTTAYPIRIVQFVPCLMYSRNDPSSKDNCPFFTTLSAPAGRQFENKVTSQVPSDGSLVVGGQQQLAYFVLHNESNAAHSLQTVSIRVTGDVQSFKSSTLTINGMSASNPQITDNLLIFTFTTPVSVDRSVATLAQLQRPGAAVTTSANNHPLQLLAGGLGKTLGGAVGVFLLIGGIRRRQGVVLALLVVVSMALVSCGGDGSTSTPSPSTVNAADTGGSTTGNGTANTGSNQNTSSSEQDTSTPVKVVDRLELVNLAFSSDSPGAVYNGLPLVIGQVAR